MAQYLPNISAANPGKRIDFVTHAVAAAHADQFAPYKAFGCDMKAPFAGTLFRFPLRTAEQAARSRLSKQAHTVASLRALLKEFESESVRDLLFLRSVECVELLEWLPGADAPVLRYSTAAENAAALRTDRAAFTRFTAASDGTAATLCALLSRPRLTRRPQGARPCTAAIASRFAKLGPTARAAPTKSATKAFSSAKRLEAGVQRRWLPLALPSTTCAWCPGRPSQPESGTLTRH